MVLPAGKAEAGREVARPDEDAADTLDRRGRLDIVERLARFHLDDDADLTGRAGTVPPARMQARA
jgi:hypothetical protein